MGSLPRVLSNGLPAQVLNLVRLNSPATSMPICIPLPVLKAFHPVFAGSAGEVPARPNLTYNLEVNVKGLSDITALGGPRKHIYGRKGDTHALRRNVPCNGGAAYGLTFDVRTVI